MLHVRSKEPFAPPASAEREVSAHTYPKLLDAPRAAEFLGISRNTLAGWRCSKRYSVPYIKIGRLVRYRQADLVAFLDSHHVG
jgi:predicted DNA-binding transcriptional regulator AlpA